MRTHEQQTIWASLDEILIGERTVARLNAPTVELYRVSFEQGRDAPPHRCDSHDRAMRSSYVTAVTEWPPPWQQGTP